MVVRAEKDDSQRHQSTHLKRSSLLILVYLNPYTNLCDNSEG